MKHLALQSLFVLCPFLLNAGYDDDNTKPYVLEEDMANEEEYFADADEFYSDSVADTDQYETQASMQTCRSSFHKMNAGIRHTERRGVGYQTGYTTLEGFFNITDRNSSFIPFVDLRGHVFDDGRFAGNVGIGERTALTSISHLLGTYLYYDVRQDRHHLVVNQLTPGIELLGNRMEYRINGYFPFGNKKSHKYQYAFHEFDGNRIILKAKQRKALTGGDAEVGVHMTQSMKYDLYAGAGPYYFSTGGASSWGGKARLTGRYKEYITLEASYSYDNLFRSIVQGTIGFNVTFGGNLKRTAKDCSMRNNLWFSRAAFAPYRFEIPVVKKIRPKHKAINPATKKPWTVWFVNNTSHSSGTYESPFPTLLQAQNASGPNDMIYVFPGDGTTTGMAAGITLKDGQYFFGSGTKQYIPTTQGTISIPAFSNSMPAMANGVAIANSNVISGMNVTSGGIGLTSSHINNLTVINNQVNGSTAIIFRGTGNVNISNNTITGYTANGIVVFADPNALVTGQLSNNTITTSSATGAGITLVPTDNNNPGRFDFTIAENTIPGGFDGFGINVNMLSTNSQVAVTGNTVTMSTAGAQCGILLTNGGPVISNGQNGKMLVADNTVIIGAANTNINLLGGIGLVDYSNPGPYAVQDRVIIENNIVNALTTRDYTLGPTPGAYVAFIQNGSGGGTIPVHTYCLSMDNNIANNPNPTVNNLSGYYFKVNNGGVLNIDSFDDNIGSVTTSTTGSGTVNFVPEGSCGR